MFVDASALVAILLDEPDVAFLAARLEQSRTSCITPFVIMETGLAVMRELDLTANDIQADIERTLRNFRISKVALTDAMVMAGLKAFERYGKGRRHPARLNMGDCLSYGAARVLGVPLLYKGYDFAKTDIRSALA
jgi:ribonuclease VapC